jgi:predicted permease
LTGLGAAEVLSGPFATPDLFPMLGADPVLGRTFDASDGMDARRIVLSWGFWQNRLGGAPDVIGRTVLLDDRAHEIIGVLPRTFSLTGYDGDFWRVLGDSDYHQNRDNHDLRVVARLREGVTIERARQETATILRSLSERHGGESRTTHLASVFPRLEDETRQVRTPLFLLLAGSGLLLLVACVNFAALRLGAGIDRETELQVRAAMGAGRLRIARQMVTESIVLALFGAAAGLLLALAITRALTLLAPVGVPRLDHVTLDARATLFAMLLAIVVGIAFGMMPALTLSRSVSARLHAGRHGSRGRHRLHSALVIAQTGLATVLLVCAGVLTRTLLHLDAVDPGFEPARLLTVRIQPPYARFRLDGGDLNASVRSYYDRLVREIEAVPGVSNVALASTLPFSADRGNNQVVPEGHRPEIDGEVIAERHAVSGNYLEIIGARLVDGRLLQPADDQPNAAPVVVVSERLARRFWPDGAVGKRLDFWGGSYVVVGVIADMHDRSLRDDAYFRFYVPQQTVGAGGSLVIEAVAEPTRLISAIRARLADVDSDLPVTSILPMSDRIADSLAEQRYRARLAATFALLAAAFTAFGIYGVTSRSVARRRPEIGVRLALGARPGSLVVRILRQGVGLSAIGVVLGLAASLAATQAIASYVYGTRANDPLTLTLVALGLVGTAALACLAPSLRAARTDPLQALRSE